MLPVRSHVLRHANSFKRPLFISPIGFAHHFTAHTATAAAAPNTSTPPPRQPQQQTPNAPGLIDLSRLKIPPQDLSATAIAQRQRQQQQGRGEGPHFLIFLVALLATGPVVYYYWEYRKVHMREKKEAMLKEIQERVRIEREGGKAKG